MSDLAPIIVASTACHLNNVDPTITFPTTGGGDWKVWYRFLSIRGADAFEIGNICETCEFWFRKLEPKAEPVEIESIQKQLAAGIKALDSEVVEAFSPLLQSGTYRIALFQLVPELVLAGSTSDYFANEQVRAWPEFEAAGPNDPATPYFRVVGRSSVTMNSEGDQGFEFIVPLQVGKTLSHSKIEEFAAELRSGETPTAVAVGVLDIKQHHDSDTAHWCLTHFLLDGHHKVMAAAQAGLPITLLSFIASDHGISSTEAIDKLLADYPRN